MKIKQQITLALGLIAKVPTDMVRRDETSAALAVKLALETLLAVNDKLAKLPDPELLEKPLHVGLAIEGKMLAVCIMSTDGNMSVVRGQEKVHLDTLRAAGELHMNAWPAWTQDEISQACTEAEIPDSKCESLLLALPRK